LEPPESRQFAALYERWRDDIFRYVLGCLRNREDAADATQQIFANAFASFPRFQGDQEACRYWLFRIAHNEVVTRHRQRSRRIECQLAGLDWIADTSRSPEELAILADTTARLDALIHRLPPEQCRCCALRLAGMSHSEIACILGKSEAAVRVSYARGRAVLRDGLRDPERP
jgi:RNA polymerase sigma-70 factor (ECF subfamily)